MAAMSPGGLPSKEPPSDQVRSIPPEPPPSKLPPLISPPTPLKIFSLHSGNYLAGSSKVMEQVRQKILQVAIQDGNVFIKGETGTGKELAAKMIHDHSSRKGLPFQAINCGALPPDLIEKELFGYVGGSFTGACREGQTGFFYSAGGGTVFLDEIGELSPSLLFKILRTAQEGKYTKVGDNRETQGNFRIITATNRNLKEIIPEQGLLINFCNSFRQFSIDMPPLREHLEDLEEVAYSLLSRHPNGTDVNSISTDAIEKLKKHYWPGNVRELENVINRAKILAQEKTIYPREIFIEDTIPYETLLRHFNTIADSDHTVLISGEPGLPYEQIFKELHGQSSRRNEKLVAVDCAGSITEGLAASTLFGHSKTAFTGSAGDHVGFFEKADQSTLVLLNIHALPLNTQAILLRALGEKQVKRLGETKVRQVAPRIIAVSDIDLIKAVEEGKFRQDLYYRLNVFPFRIPTLRERSNEIPIIAMKLLLELKGSKEISGFSEEAMDLLQRHPWTGNHRELENVICRAVARAKDKIERQDIEFDPLLESSSHLNSIPKYHNQFIELVTKDDPQNSQNVFAEIKLIAIKCYVAKKLAEGKHLTKDLISRKFDSLSSALSAFYRSKGSSLSNLIKEVSANSTISLTNIKNIHPVLEKYLNLFLEQVTNDEPITLANIRTLAIKCITLNQFINNPSNINLTALSQKFGMARLTFRRALQAGGHKDFTSLLDELKLELAFAEKQKS